MTKQEHLLTIVSEECAEVHQRCSKALRFGMQEVQPGQPHTNESRILQEFNDLVAVIELLIECPIKNILSTSEIDAKKAKVEKYLSYSEQCANLKFISFMVKFKIKRDNARIIDKSFMPYMIMVAEMKMRDAENDSTFLTAKIFLSLICQVKLAFKKKLLNTPNNLTFKLSDAEGVAFYKFLMEQPIEETQVYVATFRQQLCDLLHKQLIEPYLPDEDQEEVEEADFIKSI